MKSNSLPSRLFDRNAVNERINISAAKYERHVDCSETSMDDDSSTDSQILADNGKHSDRGHREMHFAFIPEKYEPLMGYDEDREKAREEKKKRKKEKYKKVRKNVRKALRSTWKCLMLGLYNFALGYSTPISVATTFSPDFHPGKGWP